MSTEDTKTKKDQGGTALVLLLAVAVILFAILMFQRNPQWQAEVQGRIVSAQTPLATSTAPLPTVALKTAAPSSTPTITPASTPTVRKVGSGPEDSPIPDGSGGFLCQTTRCVVMLAIVNFGGFKDVKDNPDGYDARVQEEVIGKLVTVYEESLRKYGVANEPDGAKKEGLKKLALDELAAFMRSDQMKVYWKGLGGPPAQPVTKVTVPVIDYTTVISTSTPVLQMMPTKTPPSRIWSAFKGFTGGDYCFGGRKVSVDGRGYAREAPLQPFIEYTFADNTQSPSRLYLLDDLSNAATVQKLFLPTMANGSCPASPAPVPATSTRNPFVPPVRSATPTPTITPTPILSPTPTATLRFVPTATLQPPPTSLPTPEPDPRMPGPRCFYDWNRATMAISFRIGDENWTKWSGVITISALQFELGTAYHLPEGGFEWHVQTNSLDLPSRWVKGKATQCLY